QAREVSRQRQSEPETLPAGAAMEPFEDLAPCFGRDAGSSVADRDDDVARVAADAHFDGAVLRRELDRVAEQMAERLPQAIAVALDMAFGAFVIGAQIDPARRGLR